MLVMERDRSYSALLDGLRGRKVLIWTCNTCARLCNSIGGTASAEALAERLSDDGVEVVGVLSTSASCIVPKIVRIREENQISEYDIVLALTCDIGADCASKVFGKEIVNPIRTIGPGYLDAEGRPMASDGSEMGPMSSSFL